MGRQVVFGLADDSVRSMTGLEGVVVGCYFFNIFFSPSFAWECFLQKNVHSLSSAQKSIHFSISLIKIIGHVSTGS